MNYIPDRNILRKVREYDPYLYLQWNESREYFELWRRATIGRQMVTPVTKSIYEERAPKKFTPLDDRLLWWIYNADNERKSNPWLEYDKRFKAFEAAKKKRTKELFTNYSKDAYASVSKSGRYITQHKKKNTGRPDFNKVSQGSFARPDCQNISSPRIFTGSKNHALKVNYKR